MDSYLYKYTHTRTHKYIYVHTQVQDADGDMDSYFHLFARLPEDTRARTAVINDEMLRTFSKTDARTTEQPPPDGSGVDEPHEMGLGECNTRFRV